ncbi:hypothetical protein FPQ18DRAFT_300785 [Pyronema domesticum]|nr:hypothetical protein FPQ18DRAFT_300785 [Pyronema domesticum]
MSSFQSSGSVPETIVSTSPAEILQMIAGDGIPECSWMDLFYIGPQDKAIYEELPGLRNPDDEDETMDDFGYSCAANLDEDNLRAEAVSTAQWIEYCISISTTAGLATSSFAPIFQISKLKKNVIRSCFRKYSNIRKS